MEFQSCAFEGKALLFADDRDFAIDSLKRSRNLLKKWDGEDAVEGIGFLDPLLPYVANKSFLGDQCLKINGDGTKGHPPMTTQNELLEFVPRFPNKASDEKFDAASQIDGDLFSVDNSVLSFPESSVSGKRAKVTNLQSSVPTCQVFGCNKDLSSSKDYHRRHKVCDVHSKTAAVVVNGIRQRFCQQCSRFHILAEFDEGKRSCRKRLAGHNKRRRKPQFNTHLGSTYFTTDASNSLIFSRILSNGFFNLQCNEARRTSQLEVDVILGESVLRFHGMGKQYPSKNCLKSPSSFPELYSSSESVCALSLLSARKQNHPLVSTGNDNATLFTAQNSAETLRGTSYKKNIYPLDYSSNRATVDSEIQSAEANALKLKSYLPPQGANTVDLLELLLHLQRVEQQKYYVQADKDGKLGVLRLHDCMKIKEDAREEANPCNLRWKMCKFLDC